MGTRFALLPLTACFALLLVASGCTGKPDDAPAGQLAPVVADGPAGPEISVTPADNANNVPVSVELGIAVRAGVVTTVELRDEQGGGVDGAMRADDLTWLSAEPLQYGRTYLARVVATDDAGQSVTRSSRFTTMAKPAKRTTTNLYLEDGETYGVAMPVILEIRPGIPKKARAGVQRRLFVRSNPPQPGSWHWSDDGQQVSYRPPQYWRAGTKISVRSALGGLPIDKDTYGDADRTATVTIGGRTTLDINNKGKQMSVFRNDKLVRKIPVSLGKPRTPTSSGTMVIMQKFKNTVFDTRGEPNGGYVVKVANAQRLTWGGEFIHAAPWSAKDQGRRNVSHGCTNVSNKNAAWLMTMTRIGDPVTVRGTEVRLAEGNGWTMWNMSWAEFVKGSALPPTAGIGPAPGAPLVNQFSPAAPAPAPPPATGSWTPDGGPAA